MGFNHGAVWWSELMTRDVGAAVDYYTRVLGWSFDSMPMEDGQDYFVGIAHGKPVAGIMDMTGLPGFDDVPPHWFTYFAVDDVATALDKTRIAGGEVIRTPFDVPDVGRVAMVRDSSGAALGLMTPVFPGDQLVAEDEAEAVDASDDEENFPV